MRRGPLFGRCVLCLVVEVGREAPRWVHAPEWGGVPSLEDVPSFLVGGGGGLLSWGRRGCQDLIRVSESAMW